MPHSRTTPGGSAEDPAAADPWTVAPGSGIMCSAGPLRWPTRTMDVDTLTRVVDEVAELVRDRGELSKDEVLAAWPLTEEEYSFVRDRVLARSGIVGGGGTRGGFRAGPARDRRPGDDESERLVLRSGWERATVDRLCELFQHSEIERLLGRLVYTIRQARKHRSGDDRRGTKRELAAALVIQHGQDLLRDPEVRRAVGRACGDRKSVV